MDLHDNTGWFIINDENRASRFRPSDWAERISAMLASFGPDHRLRYSELMQPCLIEGRTSLVVARSLSRTHPEIYRFILDFARANDLAVQEDRRFRSVPITVERRAPGHAGGTAEYSGTMRSDPEPEAPGKPPGDEGLAARAAGL